MDSTRAKPGVKRPRRGPPQPRPKNPPQPKPTDADLMASVFGWVFGIRQALDSIIAQTAELRDQTRNPKSPLAGRLNTTALNEIIDGANATDSAIIDMFANAHIRDGQLFGDVFEILGRMKGGAK